MNKKIVISQSGGLDSTVLAYHLIDLDFDLYPVWFNYGSKHNSKEKIAIENICNRLGILDKLKIVDISFINNIFTSSLLSTGDNIPNGYYSDKNMASTVVPFRNGIFISILSGYAASINTNLVAIGVHSGDHAIYPDCREDFINKMQIACESGLNLYNERFEIITPFLKLNKTQIVTLGEKLHVPFELTWTCYNGRNKACGTCGSCIERLEAFHLNYIKDPLDYEDDESWKSYCRNKLNNLKI